MYYVLDFSVVVGCVIVISHILEPLCRIIGRSIPLPTPQPLPLPARCTIRGMIQGAFIVGLVIFLLYPFGAHAGEQTRFYGPDGRSVGTAVPLSGGSTRYYDASGRSLGTSTTSPSGTTTFYGPGGSVTGRASGPATSPAFSGTRR
jgi:hypothetical protein